MRTGSDSATEEGLIYEACWYLDCMSTKTVSFVETGTATEGGV